MCDPASPADAHYPARVAAAAQEGANSSTLRPEVCAARDNLLIPSVVVGRWLGAEPGAKVVLILGSANQFGEGFFMATGAYLSSKSQRE